MTFAFSEPEAFIHHALREMGVPSHAVHWLAPFVISIDGRSPKWCEQRHAHPVCVSQV